MITLIGKLRKDNTKINERKEERILHNNFYYYKQNI